MLTEDKNCAAWKINFSLIIFIRSYSSLLRQVQNLFQSELCTQCDLELPPSNDSILSSPSVHPVSSYIFFLVFLSLLSPPLTFPSITRCRRHFLRKIQGGSYMTGTVYTCLHTNQSRSYLNHLVWPVQLAFRLLISCRIFLCSLTLSNTSHFSHERSNWWFSILLQHHISKLSRCLWSTARRVQVSTQHRAMFFVDNNREQIPSTDRGKGSA